MVNQFEQIVIR